MPCCLQEESPPCVQESHAVLALAKYKTRIRREMQMQHIRDMPKLESVNANAHLNVKLTVKVAIAHVNTC